MNLTPTYHDRVVLQRNFDPRGRRIAWFPMLLGCALLADAVWSVNAAHVGPALVVGTIGLERLLHAAAYYWNGRVWPWRLRAIRLTPRGLEFEESSAYGQDNRTTLLPGGLILKAATERGDQYEARAEWVAVLYTILGTIVWSECAERSDADHVTGELQALLEERADEPLTPPQHTGCLDVIGERRAVMWGKPPVIPAVVIVRCVLLLAAIFTLPALVVDDLLVLATWTLVVVTVSLLTFPFVGAVNVLSRRGRLVGYGASVQQGELRAWEQSAPDRIVPLTGLQHVGLATLHPTGDPLAIRLIAHTNSDTPVESYVSTSWFVRLAAEAYRLVAEGYDIGGPTLERSRWSVRLPGGAAEAIEAVSWMQRFVAEARTESE
jgi:hypothetical protein